MNKVLIFGINGFTGKHFLNYIKNFQLTNDFDFVGVDKSIDEDDGTITCVQADLLQDGFIFNTIKEEMPDYIINLAGMFNAPEYDTMLAVNAGISQKILDACVKNEIEIKKILLVGSAAEYGPQEILPIVEAAEPNPNSLYGLTKVVQTQYAQFYSKIFNININVARTFNILGQGLSPALSIGSFLKQIQDAADGDQLFVGNLETKRDYLDVVDVVDAYWKILLNGKSGEIYNVCRGSSDYIKDILSEMIQFSGKSLDITVKSEFVKKFDIIDSYGDNSKLMRDTGWISTIPLQDSIKNLM
jgi:GDP-4-dehydro-6-deoxy-D-mannose reductase